MDDTIGRPDDDHVDLNHVSLLRMSYLTQQNRALIAQVQFADAKAGALLAVMGLVVTREPDMLIGVTQAEPFGIAYAVALAAALVFALATVFPRYPGKRGRARIAEGERWSWLAMRARGDDFAAWATGAETADLVGSAARSNVGLSRVIHAKFRMMRLAFAAAGVLFGLTAARYAGVA
ncbi:Pycsar system effector family protein [Jannaschia sp. LMIT008]|uniref:Pycsar system effector family protein n=1 Tax=Jannaschia maritima TaxID=3032585 RepID=UPI0028116069|nr:Pycsar system effector family protein [Jannaschia sp. LMIT008]